MPDRIAVIDFETTGMSPAQGARPTEIGVAMIEGGRIVARYQSLMNAGAWVPPFIEQLTGISNAMLAGALRSLIAAINAHLDGAAVQELEKLARQLSAVS